MRRLALALALLLTAGPAGAETIKLAVGQRGNWDTSVAEIGRRICVFARHGLEPEILYTAGGAETQQAVLARSVDVGIAAGTLGVLGATDLFWYMPAASPIRGPADLADRTVGFSTAGSSSDMVLRLAMARLGIAFRMDGLDAMMADGVSFRFLAAPLSAEQLRSVLVLDTLKP